jgi:hypothetical protein
MGHSLASAVLGLVGQPRLQKWVQKEVGTKTSLGGSATNLVASAIVSPIYVVVTNPLSCASPRPLPCTHHEEGIAVRDVAIRFR